MSDGIRSQARPGEGARTGWTSVQGDIDQQLGCAALRWMISTFCGPKATWSSVDSQHATGEPCATASTGFPGHIGRHTT
eukprot:3004684-Amphidinium_carterae.2